METFMKKNTFLIFFIVATLLATAGGFAAGAADQDTAVSGVSASKSPKSSSGGELQKTGHDAFNEKDRVVDETRSGPVATVSGAEKNEVLAVAVKAEVTPRKVPSRESSGKKAVETSVKKETVSELNTEGMQKRWKALFSKEAGPDSVLYTVKSGDSLYVLARKNHTTMEFVKKINNLKSNDIYIGKKLKIHTAPFSIVIDKSRNTLVLYSGGEPVKKYSVATGKKNCTPVGSFKVTDKLVNPTWFRTGAILPPGSPENALGTRWIGLDKPSYGIHGTIEPKSIGTQASEGCIRMLNEDVEELYSVVPVGTKVTIQD
jgi:lipoprotein-anchoring transpeptidase ErfK/SrfK